VALSGFDGLDNPHPGAAVAQALRQGSSDRIEIEALVYDALETGAWMPGAVDRINLMPSLHEGDEATLRRVLEIHSQRPLDALIPNLDLDVPVYGRIAGRLERAGIRTLLPAPESLYATSKLRLPKLCHAQGILAPRTIHVLELDDIGLHADQFGYPLMVKSVVSGAKRVSNAEEARTAARALSALWGNGVLLQEALGGEEFVAAAVAARDGALLGLVCMRKLGMNERGKGVLGVVVDDPRIEQHASAVLSNFDWCGPLELEFIRPHGSNKLYLLEVNNRFPAWIMLSHWSSGNLATLLLDEILRPGRRTFAPARPGVTFVRDIDEIVVPLSRVRDLYRRGSCTGTPPRVPRNRAGGLGDIRVAVSGLSTLDVVNAGLGAARALRDAPDIGLVYGLGRGPFDSGIYRDELFDAVFKLPLSSDPQALLERLRNIHRQAPFDVLVPCLDAEIPLLIEVQDQLEAMGVRTLLPTLQTFERRSKRCLARISGIVPNDAILGIPETRHAQSEEEVLAAAQELGMPIAVKGPVSHALRANSLAEARTAWAMLREKGCTEALVQPFIDGERFAVAAVCCRNHALLASLAVKKLRTCDRGSTWSAIRVHQPELESRFASCLRDLEWVGPAEGEFIRDELSDRFYLIEVNPRFTAWIGYSAHCGVNHPYLAVCEALGRTPHVTATDGELVFMRGCEDVRAYPSAFAAMATKGVLRHA
jgi:carbamoyl-phosphate synthase large subunit